LGGRPIVPHILGGEAQLDVAGLDALRVVAFVIGMHSITLVGGQPPEFLWFLCGTRHGDEPS
jgi:hypothetical protein